MDGSVSRNRFVSLVITLVMMFSFLGPLSSPASAQSTSEADRLFFCDFRNQGLNPLDLEATRLTGSVATWWTAYKPAGVDCFDLAIYNSPETCSLDASFTSYVYASIEGRGWGYHDRLTWYELNDAGGVVTYSQTFPVKYPEDYNGGSVKILINFNSPEKDIGIGSWTPAGDKSHWRSYSRGVEYTLDTDCEPPLYYYGCSQGYFKNNGYGAETTLAEIGLGGSGYGGSYTLLEVLSNPGSGKVQRGVQTFDGYIRQQVTAWLNIQLYGGEYPFTWQEVLDGTASMADLEYYNHGGENVLCE